MKCKKCNNELIEYRIGASIEYICPVCDEAPATQVENLIEFDTNKYVVRIVTVKTYEVIKDEDVIEIDMVPAFA